MRNVPLVVTSLKNIALIPDRNIVSRGKLKFLCLLPVYSVFIRRRKSSISSGVPHNNVVSDSEPRAVGNVGVGPETCRL